MSTVKIVIARPDGEEPVALEFRVARKEVIDPLAYIRKTIQNFCSTDAGNQLLNELGSDDGMLWMDLADIVLDFQFATATTPILSFMHHLSACGISFVEPEFCYVNGWEKV